MHVMSFFVHFHFTSGHVGVLNVQYSMGEKHFHHRYRATQVAICPSLAYIGQAVICKRWTAIASCLHFSIVTVKVNFAY